MIHNTRIRQAFQGLSDSCTRGMDSEDREENVPCGTFLGRGLPPCAGFPSAPRSVPAAPSSANLKFTWIY